MSMPLRSEQEENSEQPVHIAERLANTILDLLYEKRTWAVADLRAANFSLDDIARYLPEAISIVDKRARPSQR